MDLNPLHDRVVVRVLEAEGRSAGGIVIPDAAKEKPNQGQVLALGEGRILENGTVVPVAVAVGDCVLFGQQAGHKVKVNGEELTILREEEILATIKE